MRDLRYYDNFSAIEYLRENVTLLENPFLATKTCSDFTSVVIWTNIICVVSLANHLRAIAHAFRSLTTHQSY